MGNLAPAENDRDFNAVFLSEELLDMHDFKIYVVFFDFSADFNLFDYRSRLTLMGFPLPFSLFIKEFPIIHYPANGGLGVGRYLDQIQALFVG